MRMACTTTHKVDCVKMELHAKLGTRSWTPRRGLGSGKDRCEKGRLEKTMHNLQEMHTY